MRRLRRSNSSATVNRARRRRLDSLARPQSLLGERDAAGLREGAEVRCENSDTVAAVAHALELEHKYRSVVIVSAPENGRSTRAGRTVLDEFEKTAWVELEPGSTRPIPWRTLAGRAMGKTCGYGFEQAV